MTSLTDTEFRRNVEAQALAMGYPADLAKFLAKNVGKEGPRMATARVTAKARAKARTDEHGELKATLRALKLPEAMADLFRDAGHTLAQARDMLRATLRPSDLAPMPGAVAALGMQLLAKVQRKGAKQ